VTQIGPGSLNGESPVLPPELAKAYGEWWFRLWQVFLGWSVEIAAQGSSTCFQLVANKNLDRYQRRRWIGARSLGERTGP
jgi:sphingolipid C9-methyltransferase